MSFIGDIESHFKADVSKAEAAVAALVPQTVKDELGSVGHALVASIVYDAKQLGIQAEQLSAPLIAQAWTALKSIAASAFATVASGGSFSAALATAETQAKSEAVSVLVPGLKVIGQTTLKSALTMAGQLVVSGVVPANPTSPSASSPQASPSAPSVPSTPAPAAS